MLARWLPFFAYRQRLDLHQAKLVAAGSLARLFVHMEIQPCRAGGTSGSVSSVQYLNVITGPFLSLHYEIHLAV